MVSVWRVYKFVYSCDAGADGLYEAQILVRVLGKFIYLRDDEQQFY